MTQDRTIRSNAPSPSSRYSQPSAPTRSSSPILFLPKPQSPNFVLPTVSVPNIPKPASPNAHLSPSSRPHAPAIHTPALPLTFHWRCCRSGCRANNIVCTTTHFTHLLICDSHDIWYRAPSYRLDKCSDCQHRPCEWCLLLQVEGQSEWRGSERETGLVGVWRRIGMWKEGRHFGDMDDKVRKEDVMRGLKTEDRVDQRWAREWMKEREWKQKVSSR